MHEPGDKIVFKVYQSTSHQFLQKRGRRQWAKPLGSAAPPVGSEACKTRFAFLQSSSSRTSLNKNPLPHWPNQCRRPLPKWRTFCSEKTSSEIQTPKKMHLLSKMEPFWEPMGTQKSQKPVKVPPKIALFTPSEKRLKNHRFLDPPEPSELSWRLHKTSIFTCWPCPQNGIETTSQNLHFGYLWIPKSPTVTKRSVPENALTNTCKT